MTRMLVNTRIRVEKALEERELGQGTLEYLGIVIVAAILVVALVTAFNSFDLGSKITEQLNKITSA
ncbi:hypothetical protein [Actinotalea sp. K2]|uniref:hypothetical protein n=1 Tax=Actinotalea sp. K2 TaxID=2939438 RepID=UPI0020175676|nr:hypothetical protein [Actinotalea sp. K2]MCL3859934.1 hypothetical protein [Actinotalea sp. K2]